MVIPRTLTADEFKAAPADDQALYAQGEDGSYSFVGENAGELRRGKIRVSTDLNKAQRERDSALQKLAEYEQKQEDAAKEKEAKEAKSTQDVKKIEEYWQTKMNREIKSRDEQINKLRNASLTQYQNSIISAQASKLALPEHEYVIKLALEKRVKATLDNDGNPQTVIYGNDGQPSHDTLEDLAKEMKKDPRFKTLLKGAEVGSGTTKPQKQPSLLKEEKPLSPLGSSKEQAAEFQHFRQATPDRLAKFLQSNIN